MANDQNQNQGCFALIGLEGLDTRSLHRFVIGRDPAPVALSAAKVKSDLDDPFAALSSIPSQPPRVGAMPEGCRFHPRCAYAQDSCRTGAPPPLELPVPAHATRCLRHPELTLRGTT